MRSPLLLVLLGIILMTGSAAAAEKNAFQQDVDFLEAYVGGVIVLGESVDGPQIAVVPAYQARVMTSTTGGPGLYMPRIQIESSPVSLCQSLSPMLVSLLRVR